MPDRDHVSEYGQLTLLPPTGGLPTADCSDTWLSTGSSSAFHWPNAEMEANRHFSQAARRAAPTATTWSDCGVRAGVQHPSSWPRNCPMDAQDRTAVFGAPLQYDPKVEETSPMPSFAVHPDGSLSDFADEEDQDDSKKTTLDDKTPDRKKKTRGRVKIRMEFIENKLRRYTTFSKRKTGIMKKAYELSTLTGTQVMLLVASETGHVYTFATPKLQPMITSESGKALIQTCLNSPDPLFQAAQSHSRMSSTGYEETELAYPVEEECKHSEMITRTAGLFPGSTSMNGSCQSPLDQVSPSSTASLQQLGMPSLHGMPNYLPSAGSPSGQPKVASPSLNTYSQGLFSSAANTYSQGHSPSVSQHAAVARESTSPLLHPTKQHYHPQSPTLSPSLPQSTLPSTPHQVGNSMLYGSGNTTAMHGNVQHGMSAFNQLLPNISSHEITATTPSPHSPLPQSHLAVAGEQQQVQRMTASEFYTAAASMVPGLMQRTHNNSSAILETPAYRELPGVGQPLISGSFSHRISIAQ